MTSLQECRLNMYMTLESFLKMNALVTKGLPQFVQCMEQLSMTIPEIQESAELQKTSNKGVVERKNLLKESLVVQIDDYVRKLKAYAKFSGDSELSQRIKLKEGKLRQLPDTAVRDYAQIAYDIAQPIIKSLAGYQITATSQQKLAKTIKQYNAIIGESGVSRIVTGQVTKKLNDLFRKADTAIKDIDTLVDILKQSNPSFYDAYKKARKVVYNGSTSLTVKGHISDAETGAPIRGAKVTFVHDSEGGTDMLGGIPELEKKSAAKGGFNVKTLAPGIYNVNISKVGYADQTVSLAIDNGELNKLQVKLNKQQ